MFALVLGTLLSAAPACAAAAKDPILDVGPCDKKPAEACVTAGDALLTQGCRDEALARYETGCKRGVLRACSKLGFRLVERSHDAKVVKRAVELFTKACDGNDALGCANLASFTWDGEGVPRDPKKAAALSEKACNAGDAFSCGTLGSLWAQGELGPKDVVKAAGYFERACRGGSASGCNQLGMAMWGGEGVKKDPEKAMDVWAKACSEKNAAACANLGRALKSRGDDARAHKVLSRACSLGDEGACKDKGLPGPDLEE
ncbi:MAG: tetratricopeptide repeat protein [Myxococcota bacterium]